MLGLISKIFWFLVKVLVSILFYATPVIGFWLVSSLAAYMGGPAWMAWAAGAFLFPIIPGLWELHYWTHRTVKSKPLLTFSDRVSLRTFGVGIVFLGSLLYLYPQTAFVALSTRGDWMLDGVKDVRADQARKILFATAGGLEWLYDATKKNPYKSLIDPKARQLAEEATKERERESTVANEESKFSTDDSLFYHPPPIARQDKTDTSNLEQDSSSPQTDVKTATPKKIWPWKDPKLHPAVASMPASIETSISSVAKYIAEHESDPTLRIKALHDYVADRVAYDSDSYYAGVYPPQDAETVFRTHKSVCAGYANLLSALADASGEKIVVVGGDARDMSAGDRLAGGGHAWNAARIKDHWYLIDACWDAGFVSKEKGFTKAYRTDYLLTPPNVMIEDHFPEEATWQLLDRPLSQGDFLRQPMLRPRFQSAGLVLVSPTRARIETESTAVAILKNPNKQWIIASLEMNDNQVGPTSFPTNQETIKLEFPLQTRGTYRLNMFTNDHSQYGSSYDFVGSVDFVNR